MTKTSSILHRAAALLAALCLLAGMALPVYATQNEPIFFGSDAETIPAVTAETTAGESTESEQNPAVTGSETVPGKENTPPAANEPKTETETTVQGTETVPNHDGKTQETADEQPPATDKGADDNNTTTDNAPAADNAPDDDNAPTAAPTLTNNNPADTPDGQDPTAPDTVVTPNPTADAAETTTAEQDILFADGGNTDVTAPATSGYTLYFIAPKDWEENLSKENAYLRLNVNFYDNEWQPAEMTQIGKTAADCRLYAINFVPRLECTTICTCQFQCYVGTNHSGQFEPIANTQTALTSLVGRVFDGTTNAWSDYQKEYAGKTLYFKNDSAADLTSVKAVFYTWDWQNKTLQKVDEQEVGTVAAGTQSEVLIPPTASGFVRFTWTNGQSALYKYSNIQYTDENTAGNKSTPINIATQNRFTYGAEGSAIWDKVSNNVLAAGKTIYFDSTFSSYAYTGDSAIQQNPMPRTGDDSSAKMYCFLQTAENTFERVEMTPATDPKAPGRQLWSYTIPQGKSYTAVQFSAWNERNQNAKDGMTDVLSEDDIPANLKEPCFFADNGDPSAYKDGNVYREGYWGEKASVRDAESGKGKTKNDPVVDIASNETFTQEPATKYITSTLYDYYTDYELNGFNRDDYPYGDTISQRGFVTFEQFNRALSSAYEANGNVQYPLYTGHFQPSINGWGNFFADVAKDMKLYGWSKPDGNDGNEKAYITFMAVNNSALDTGLTNTDNNYTRTFQGLVEDKTSDGTKDGLPLLKGTTLVDPHFNKDFLQGKNAFNTVLGKVYENVSFPLKKEKVFAGTRDDSGNNAINDAEYWYFDSNETSLYLKQDSTEGYFLAGSGTKETSRNRGSDNGESNTPDKMYGFFPFNQTVTGSAPKYNYGFGAKLQFDFTLTEDGQVTVGQSGKKVPIQFFFSGDDDVWVYIDGDLVLDVGGAHDRAAGLLEFGKGEDGQNTVTSWVSDTKESGRVYEAQEQPKTVKFTNKQNISNDYAFKYRTKDPKPLKKQNIHTLTMYYMERGMWESNMALAFNFPDHNEFQVEKQVDVSGVNELFQKSFLDQKIFTFNIQNLATHYGPKETTTPTIKTYELPDTVYNSATKPLKHVTTPPVDASKDRAVLWKSDRDDPTSKHRAERRGTLAWGTPIDISQYSYLTFDVYVEGEQEETCALSNLYVELWDDTSRNQMGCLGTKGLRSSDVYGAATALHPGQWYTVRLMLNSLEKDKDFNSRVKKITVGDNYARSIYLRNFTFSSAPAMPEQTGFTTAQYDVPDYGSATTGKLQNAAYAVFSSSDGTGNVVNENGDFLLEADETVTFNDQFRRGSYIALKEEIDTDLYDTSWTVCENGVPVTSVGGNRNIVETGKVNTLQNVSSNAPNDGRTEKVVGEGLDGHPIQNKYTDAKKPEADTLVFRSYSDKADPNELTKLKVVYTNTVKTGKLVIRKVPADGEGEQLKGKTFTFTVQFGDVGGQSLGEKIDPQEYTCKVEDHGTEGYYGQIEIEGIPVGTRFVVSENPTEYSLKEVSIEGIADGKVSADGMAYGTIEYGKTAKAKFVNTARELIDITVKKVWQKQDGKTEIPQDELPEAIHLQLQRTETPDVADSWRTVENVVLTKPTDYNGWTHLFTGLDKYDASKTVDGNPTFYTYRVLESATGNEGDWHGGKADDVIKIDGKTYKVLNPPAKGNSDDKTLTLTLTNQLQDAKYNLVITKQDAQDKSKLGGVWFKLEKLDAEPSEPPKTGKTVEKTGELTFTGLTPGSYRLTETKTAKGYTLLAEPIEFTLTADGHYQRGDTAPVEITPDADGVYNIALTVYNRKGFALPHTGADAPSLWLLIGLPALVAVLLVLVFRYNKKGGKHS